MGFAEIREKLLKKTRQQVQERFSRNDINLVRGMNTLDELDLLFNQLYEQIVEWYAVHFPELSRLVADPDLFLACITMIGDRKNFSEKNLAPLAGAKKSTLVLAKAKASNGSEISPAVLAIIQSTAETARSLKKQRGELEKFIEKETRQLMPHACSLVSPLLAARLLTAAGSEKKLASMPSSTLQVLGAEKALFRHKKFGSRPPKHGMIFQHPGVQNAGKEKSGKAARALAAQLSIAIRQDYFA